MKNEREKNGQTELLYETDGLLTSADAVVIATGDDNGREYVVLDRTVFFPEGGGQCPDTGVLGTPAGNVRVTDVQTVRGQVRHYTDSKIEEGAKVTCIIDADRRFALMQNHGAEHIISGIVNRLFGYDNVGFHMTESEAIFDLDGPLTDEQIRDVEERANRTVFADVPITIGFPSPEEAEGLQYRSKLDINENVRLVTIEGVDTCACCAPHLRSTGQIGVIKIVDAIPHRGGIRITMTAGINAYRDYSYLHDSNSEIMGILSSKRGETAGHVRDLTDRLMKLREDNTDLRRKVTKIVTESVISGIKEKDPDDGSTEPVFTEDLDPTGLRELVNECTKYSEGIICAFSGNDKDGYRYIFAVRASNAENAGLQEFTAGFNSGCSGRGGGSKLMTQGTCMAKRTEIERFLCG